jgi:hypothetical protein
MSSMGLNGEGEGDTVPLPDEATTSPGERRTVGTPSGDRSDSANIEENGENVALTD